MELLTTDEQFTFCVCLGHRDSICTESNALIWCACVLAMVDQNLIDNPVHSTEYVCGFGQSLGVS